MEALVDRMVDPVSRAYRYRLARRMLPLVVPLGITPNAVSVLHFSVATLAAGLIAWGAGTARLAACVLIETKFVLDCLDGVLARATGAATPDGRTCDALADASAYVVVCLAIVHHLHVADPAFPAVAAAAGAIAVGGVMAWSHDFYFRRIASALRSRRDGIVADLAWRVGALDTRPQSFVTRFGYAFDRGQVAVLEAPTIWSVPARLWSQPDSTSSADEIARLAERATSTRGRRVLLLIGLLSGDNALAILNVGVAIGSPGAALLVVCGVGASIALVAIVACRRVLWSPEAE